MDPNGAPAEGYGTPGAEQYTPTDIDIYNSCSRYSEKVKVKVNRNLRHRRSDYCVLIVIP